MRNDFSESYHSFLESLKGKTVTIYRGGPESKTGILLDVQSDYVTLYAQNNNNNNNNNNNKNNNNNNQQNNNNNNIVVYYQAHHVKSISEDSKSNSTQVMSQMNNQNIDYFQADHFTGLMGNLINEVIQINQGGPESKYGTLLSVSDDFIVIYTQDDGIVYFNVDHIKSISKYQNNNQNNKNNYQGQNSYPDIIEASDFQDVFKHMAHKWVAINRGGPEAMEGVLVENAGGHYTLVSNQEVLRIHPYHIKSISSGPKGSMSQNNQNENSEDSQNNQNNQNAQNSNQNTNQSQENSNKKDDNSSKNKESRKSSSSRSRSYSKEKVVKTIDYVWKGNK